MQRSFKFQMKNLFVVTFLIGTLFFVKTTHGQEMPQNMYHALETDDAKVLKGLITTKNINDCYEKMYTALSQAIKLKAIRCIDLLLKKGANVNEGCDYKVPMYFVCKYGNLETLKNLVKKGASLNPPLYRENYTLLDCAVRYNNQPIVEYLKSLRK